MGRPRKNKEAILPDISESDVNPFTTGSDKSLAVKEVKEESVASKGSFDKDEGYTVQILADDKLKTDVTFIPNKDPIYVYRWLNEKDTRFRGKIGNLLYDSGAWQLVPREHAQKIGISTDISPDGLARRNELVLARIPKELYEKKMAQKDKKNNAPMEQVIKNLQDGDPRRELVGLGAPNMKGLQTKKQLRMD